MSPITTPIKKASHGESNLAKPLSGYLSACFCMIKICINDIFTEEAIDNQFVNNGRRKRVRFLSAEHVHQGRPAVQTLLVEKPPSGLTVCTKMFVPAG